MVLVDLWLSKKKETNLLNLRAMILIDLWNLFPSIEFEIGMVFVDLVAFLEDLGLLEERKGRLD